MKIRFADARPDGAQVLALPVVGSETMAFMGGTAAVAAGAAARSRFQGEVGGLIELFTADGQRVVHFGLGVTRPDAAALEKIGGVLAAKYETSGETRLVIDLTGATIDDPAEAGARIGFGALARSWRYDAHRTKLADRQKATLDEIVIVAGGGGAEAAWAPLQALADGLFFTRTLVTEPANIVYPESFVALVRQSLEGLGVEIDVLGEDQMRALGMGALLGVSQGSAREAQLLVMRWNGTGDDAAPPTAFVGKGVTFDTGGISLKPPAGMEDMKWDMGGAGAVAGAMRVLAARKAKAHVVGVCGLVENMPSGEAQRPGDVVVSMSGQTIEVINTDAEGRLVLCDAITWVQRTYKPKRIVDLATLTGAMIISLGHEHGGLFANSDQLADQLLAASNATGEKLWRFPMGEAYDKMIESPIADMKNVGPREAGSITAAQFIKRYVDEGVDWAHLDIAGMVWASKPGPTWGKGATGFGVRLLDQFSRDVLEV